MFNEEVRQEMSETTFQEVFRQATGEEPYGYQTRLAEEGLPAVLSAPTGAGKTFGVVLAHIWRRRFHPDSAVKAATPRRLIIAQPMRTLTEQTERSVAAVLDRLSLLGSWSRPDGIHLHVLMGGRFGPDSVESWRMTADRDSIVIGTIDSVVSRALMRGYGSSRGMFPVEFALVSNGAHVVVDEVQLARQATATMRQLDGMRSQSAAGLGWRTAEPVGLTCMSATPDARALNTVDNRFGEADMVTADPTQGDLARRTSATRRVQELPVASARAVAEAALQWYRPGELTLVVVNTVFTATEVYRGLERAQGKGAAEIDLHLVHSQFRPHERRAVTNAILSTNPRAGRIVVATQAVEAGVDLNASVLLTEAAPWSSICQRAGRCNRDGRVESAQLLWFAPTSTKGPYDAEVVDSAMAELRALEGHDVTSLDLLGRDVDEGQVALRMLRRRDLEALFDTAPDLAGRDLDVASFIREDSSVDVQVAWVPDGWVERAEREGLPVPPPHEWRCPVRLSRAREWVGGLPLPHRVNAFDPAVGRWRPIFARDVRPGMLLVAAASAGGYTSAKGFDPKARGRVEAPDMEATALRPSQDQDGLDVEAGSVSQDRPQRLLDHGRETRDQARELLRKLAPALADRTTHAVVAAAYAHDCGKVHADWQAALLRVMRGETGADGTGGPWAKSGSTGRLEFLRGVGSSGGATQPPDPVESGQRARGAVRPDESARDALGRRRVNFRHEFVSALALQTTHGKAWLARQGVEPEDAGLSRYLVGAHHGFVRLLPPDPLIDGTNGVTWLGLQHEDAIPWFDPDTGEVVEDAGHVDLEHGAARIFPTAADEPGAALNPDWSETSTALLRHHGPFVLAWMETVVRLADFRSSAGWAIKEEPT